MAILESPQHLHGPSTPRLGRADTQHLEVLDGGGVYDGGKGVRGTETIPWNGGQHSP